MKEFLKQINKNKIKKAKEEGFTLIETLVAVSIFLVSVVGMMTILSSGLSNTIAAKKKMTATFLAQEGIEYIRNLRDTYVLYWGNYTDGWNEFNNRMIASSCATPEGCFYKDEGLNFNNSDLPILDLQIEGCGGVCPIIIYDASKSKYVSAGSGSENTTFRRTIKTEKINQDITKVTAIVSWDNNTKSISFSENLFNWVE